MRHAEDLATMTGGKGMVDNLITDRNSVVYTGKYIKPSC